MSRNSWFWCCHFWHIIRPFYREVWQYWYNEDLSLRGFGFFGNKQVLSQSVIFGKRSGKKRCNITACVPCPSVSFIQFLRFYTDVELAFLLLLNGRPTIHLPLCLWCNIPTLNRLCKRAYSNFAPPPWLPSAWSLLYLTACVQSLAGRYWPTGPRLTPTNEKYRGTEVRAGEDTMRF